jgi:hypothetical protein
LTRSPDPAAKPFSDQLEDWLESDGPKTIGDLGNVFGEKSFAVTILLLMFLPALPLPTGGITHVFEAIVVLLGAEMVIGAKTIWLPEKWRQRELGETLTGKAIPVIARRVRWFEKFSKPRASHLIDNPWFQRLIGLAVIALAVAAAVAPPFSGLDTLPALGAVVLCLGLILEDLLIAAIGAVIGAIGITLIITLGAAAVRLVKGAVG